MAYYGGGFSDRAGSGRGSYGGGGEPPQKRSRWDTPEEHAAPSHPQAYAAGRMEVAPADKGKGGKKGKAKLSTKVMTITADQKGGIIGHRGESINKIRDQSGSIIKVEHEPGDETATITMTGNVELAERLIKARLIEMQTEPREEWPMKFIDVEQGIVGLVIGPGGSNLREMEAKSGCFVRFIKATEYDPHAPVGKQVCNIKGPPEKIPYAEQLLLQQVEMSRMSQNQRRLVSAQVDQAQVAQQKFDLKIGGVTPSIGGQNNGRPQADIDEDVEAASQALGMSGSRPTKLKLSLPAAFGTAEKKEEVGPLHLKIPEAFTGQGLKGGGKSTYIPAAFRMTP
eukprot:TRINITY_DN51283_c0_g1_i1.p1 TRINITY_DN51283_c0_g1~~TRINITY_DN51283_c0_g1_i1.p1  ORF type:complete len:350 (-),score=70.37 TRINITY_DN51283_c0_g1_i1:79-1098(-)